MAPFRRCLRCNGLLQPAVKQEVESRLPPRTKELFNEFHVCPACGRIYWKGSHYERMQSLIGPVTAKFEKSGSYTRWVISITASM